ncbi:hypothetical protein [Paracraurococcus lichenis]|uniref:Uncharacterized protein n=1 Tax=Paracraurococcus lichenis TaxID=3064888 RepID=A0ABT9DWG1_9PROT|nr:hypothetical protein [Paracraurococcus sp. LOR1-02]MDO9708135.1 hypothetical protein [Paracraurococcus sp. LOR1-02]
MSAPPLRAAPLLVLLLLAPPALARVEVPAGTQAEAGGTTAKNKTEAGPGAFTLPMIALGLPGLFEAELLARWAAPIRGALAAERARWRVERISSRPRRGQVPPPLRPKAPK